MLNIVSKTGEHKDLARTSEITAKTRSTAGHLLMIIYQEACSSFWLSYSDCLENDSLFGSQYFIGLFEDANLRGDFS